MPVPQDVRLAESLAAPGAIVLGISSDGVLRLRETIRWWFAHKLRGV